MQIQFFDRESGKLQTELVYGDAAIRWLYESGSGRSLSGMLSRPLFSKIYGSFQASSWSRRKIPGFIHNFHIKMDEYEAGTGGDEVIPYASFNDFFIRKFRPGKRNFVSQKSLMPAFAEGRYLAFGKVDPDQVFPVKGHFLSALALLGSDKWARVFEGGSLLIARLCPVDYHRFHFPDDGKVLEEFRVNGPLHSVNPLALRAKGDILCTNERQVTILETQNFGLLAYVEVGALCVGKIVQSYERGSSFKRGDEKGYFLFGGSTVVLMGVKGQWTPTTDLLQNSSRSLETLVKLGMPVAEKS